MSEEQQKQPATVSREDLYRQVWETPMLRLGKRYGISGNGLKKICDRLQVPYPPLGVAGASFGAPFSTVFSSAIARNS